MNAIEDNDKLAVNSDKRPLIVEFYERIFKLNDFRENLDQFWSEFFLLKPKAANLKLEIDTAVNNVLEFVPKNILELCNRCLRVLKSDNKEFKKTTAIYNLYLVFGYLAKSYINGDNVLKIWINNYQNMSFIENLVSVIHSFLHKENDSSELFKHLSLKILMIYVNNYDYVNDNPFMEHIVINNVLDTLLDLISVNEQVEKNGYKIIEIIALILNYNKYEPTTKNTSIEAFSLCNSDLALLNFSKVIEHHLNDYCYFFNQNLSDASQSGPVWQWFTLLANKVSNIFIYEDDESMALQNAKTTNTILLAFYEVVRLNKNFTQTLLEYYVVSPAGKFNRSNTDETLNFPLTNLLALFFQFCSIVMQDCKSESGLNSIKLCFLILRSMSENQYMSSIMHNVMFQFQIRLYQLQMRHRKLKTQEDLILQPLACTLLDLLTEFILTHLMKKFPLDLYYQCIGIIHRVICYQKKNRIRLTYQWKTLWNALITLLKFLIQSETNITEKITVFPLCLQVVNIFNIFITFGDAFLPTSSGYDELYYEIIRLRQIFTDLYSLALKFSSSSDTYVEYKNAPEKLCNSLINIRAIIKHFVPKIDQWIQSENISTPNQTQILDIVRLNYDSLTLKLHDSLDTYESYVEKGKYDDFFLIMVRNIVQDNNDMLIINDVNEQIEVYKILQKYLT